MFCVCMCSFTFLLAVNAQKPAEIYHSPNMYSKGSQSERIQKAINEAKNTTGKVVIPRYDAVAKTDVWLIDQAILLPGNF